jgi:hypothetical protein
MFTGSITDDSGNVNDTSRVVRMMIISDAITWSIPYDCHSDDFRGVIYDQDIFIIQVNGWK